MATIRAERHVQVRKASTQERRKTGDVESMESWRDWPLWHKVVHKEVPRLPRIWNMHPVRKLHVSHLVHYREKSSPTESLSPLRSQFPVCRASLSMDQTRLPLQLGPSTHPYRFYSHVPLRTFHSLPSPRFRWIPPVTSFHSLSTQSAHKYGIPARTCRSEPDTLESKHSLPKRFLLFRYLLISHT